MDHPTFLKTAGSYLINDYINVSVPSFFAKNLILVQQLIILVLLVFLSKNKQLFGAWIVRKLYIISEHFFWIHSLLSEGLWNEP